MNEREVFTKLLDFIESAAYLGAMNASCQRVSDVAWRKHQDLRKELTEALCDD